MASINKGSTKQQSQPVQHTKTEPASNVNATPAHDQVINFNQITGGANFLTGGGGRLNELHQKLIKEAENNETVRKYHFSLFVNANLPGGEVLLIALPFNNKLYVSSIFNGAADWERSYTVGGGNGYQQEYATVKTSPTEVVTRRVKDSNGEFFLPYRRDLLNHYAKTTTLLPQDATDKTIVCTGNFAVYDYDNIDIKKLIGFADFDTRAIVCASGVVDREASVLLSTMGTKLTVTNKSAQSPTDPLGNPTFAPIVVQIARQSNNHYSGSAGGSGHEPIGEIRGYIDIQPISEPRKMQEAQKRALAQGLPVDKVNVPAVKPLFIVTSVEWFAQNPYPTSESMLFLMDSLRTLGENPTWLRRVIDAPTMGSSSPEYDIGAVGYLATGEKTNVYRGGTLNDDAKLMEHITQFWDSISVAIDVPKSGTFRSAIEMFSNTNQVNRMLTNIYGPDAKLITGQSVVATLSNVPVGIYRDSNGVVRDSRDITNMISWMNKMGGSREVIQGWLNDWVSCRGEADAVFASRSNLVNTLISNGSFELRNEVQRIVLSDEFFQVLSANNIAKNIVMSGHVVNAAVQQDGGYAGNWGDGIQHQVGQGPVQNQQFQNIPTYY